MQPAILTWFNVSTCNVLRNKSEFFNYKKNFASELYCYRSDALCKRLTVFAASWLAASHRGPTLEINNH